MRLGKIAIVAGGVLGALAAATYGVSEYFFKRTMVRSYAKREKTRKLSGTDWDTYIPHIRECKEQLDKELSRDLYITSHDGLKLHATYFPCEDSKNIVICFHGYTSEGKNDYSTLGLFYKNHGYNMLLVDERAHGDSEGKYIGFGCLDRLDAMLWIQEMVKLHGQDCRILLHGNSMGGTTVLMATGLELPKQVRAVVSDCAFTSAWEVFSSVLRKRYRASAFPIMHIANVIAKRRAGFGLNECNAREEVEKAKVPILFIHGSEDALVPCSMAHELFEACRTKKKLVVIEGAGHVESCYKSPACYEGAIEEFIFPIMEGEV